MNNKPFEYKTSPHIHECKTKEEWDKECERWHSLTPEQRQKESAEYQKRLYEKITGKTGKPENFNSLISDL